MKANKPFEEVQVSNTAIWRWVREGDVYISRMTQESMDQFKKDVDQGRADEREACAKLCDDWLVGRDDICEVAKAIRARKESA
jgi:ketol-acid reductoisomerase